MKTSIVLFTAFLVFGFTLQQPSFEHPLQNDQSYVSGFGERSHPLTGEVRFHKGLDYKVLVGTKVFASAEGTVTFVGDKGAWGNTIIVKHKSGYESWYSQLEGSKKDLKVGEKLNTGELIGYSGESGRAVGPHLHFEIRKDGQSVDPAKYLDAK